MNNSLPNELQAKLQQLGLAVPIWDRAVTKAEIQYLLDRCPFLQIVSSKKATALPEVQTVKAKSNWLILNYGDAMTASPGEFLFGDAELVNPGKGTVRRQAVDTAADMVALAQKLDWPGVHVVDGHWLMKWAIWSAALDNKLRVSGFEPSERDVARRERVKRSELEDIKLLLRR